jgi:hypothetical protein
MDKDKLEKFLANIRTIESAGGKNLRHPTVEGGLHDGDAAIGEYGLMPNTIQEYKNKRVPEEAIPDTMARDVLQAAGGDEALAAALWNRGHHYLDNTAPLPNERFDKKLETLKSNVNYKKYPKEPIEMSSPEEKLKFELIQKLMRGNK